MLGTVRRLCCWAALAGVWMTRARLCGLCAVVGDCPRLCTRPGYPGKSTSTLRTGICTAGAVTGGVAVPKVFLGRAASGRRSALGPLPNPGGEFLDVIEDFASLGHLGEDFALGVHDRGVVAAECLPDLRQ